MKMLKTSNNQLPLLTRISIGPLREWPKHVIIYKPEDAKKPARKTLYLRIITEGKMKLRLQRKDQYLRPLSLTSFSSAIRAFSRLRKDIVEGYCSLLASISFNSNCIS